MIFKQNIKNFSLQIYTLFILNIFLINNQAILQTDCLNKKNLFLDIRRERRVGVSGNHCNFFLKFLFTDFVRQHENNKKTIQLKDWFSFDEFLLF